MRRTGGLFVGLRWCSPGRPVPRRPAASARTLPGAGLAGRTPRVRQPSRSACIEGRTWGWNRAGIWVDEGCGGRFMVARRW